MGIDCCQRGPSAGRYPLPFHDDAVYGRNYRQCRPGGKNHSRTQQKRNQASSRVILLKTEPPPAPFLDRIHKHQITPINREIPAKPTYSARP